MERFHIVLQMLFFNCPNSKFFVTACGQPSHESCTARLIRVLNGWIFGYVKPQESERSPDVILISSILWIDRFGSVDAGNPWVDSYRSLGAGEKWFGV